MESESEKTINKPVELQWTAPESEKNSQRAKSKAPKKAKNSQR